MKRLLALALCLALGGCAGYTWSRPGMTAEMLAQDQQECERQARLLAADYALWGWPYWVGGPDWPAALGLRPWQRSPFSPFEPDPGLRMVVEQRISDRCMEAKGYELVKQPEGPAKPGS